MSHHIFQVDKKKNKLQMMKMLLESPHECLIIYLFPRYHPPPAENRRPHLRQHVGQRRSEDGGHPHVCPGGGRARLHHAHGAEEETEGAEAQEAQRWVQDQSTYYIV